MKSSGLSRYALTTGAAAAMLAGCGGSPAALEPGAVSPASSTSRAESRNSSRTEKEDLLYIVSDLNIAYIVDYKSGKLLQTLKLGGIAYGSGACSDSSGNVFITAFSNTPSYGGYIFEYAHGGTSPISALNDGSSNVPTNCSIDPTTENLAVANNDDEGGGHPAAVNVSIYPGAQSPPTIYTDASLQHYTATAYDNQGNLFIIGNGPAPSYPFELAELPKGASTFTSISLNQGISGTYIQWDGQHLAITDAGTSHTGAVVYRVQVSGSNASVVGTTKFNGLSGRRAGSASWIQGSQIILNYHQGKLGVWPYPAGGKVTKLFESTRFYAKAGLTISPATR